MRLANGTLGFVSEGWTEHLPEAAPTRRTAKPKRSMSRFLRGIARRKPSAPAVEVVIRDPASGVYRNLDPVLPVSGMARLANGAGLHDIMLAIDVSTSTNEYSMADVNGDGRVDDGFKGPDSIFAAEIRAARGFVSALGKLPHNGRGERIRVGVVAYAGEERFHRAEQDRFEDLDEAILQQLAQRDAEVLAALTSDYAAVDRELVKLSKRTPVGMTNAAAGVVRALIELQGLSASGARSTPRQAQKVVCFMTDGKPRLPFDRDEAEAAAVAAGNMARDADVRVNAFNLGVDRVTRKKNEAVKRMVSRSGGSFDSLMRPGDIVDALEATSFSVVERVHMRNRTTQHSTPPVATGIDGSFYGELGLALGANEIEVVAQLTDGREESRVFQVVYEEGRPPRELALELERVRRENRALIEKIKGELSLEIAEARKRQKQRKRLEIDAEARTPWPAARE